MEMLFSYGTLREDAVQRAVFGRGVAGSPDAIVGHRIQPVVITDPAAVAISGRAEHTILEPTGRDEDRVEGMVLSLTAAELALADAYEDAAYKRVRARLRSGTDVWVYVRA
jgi:gamma-glutamylcyclotransferase (GGCT)/AIG2-like uncharacterized protein YtfP